MKRLIANERQITKDEFYDQIGMDGYSIVTGCIPEGQSPYEYYIQTHLLNETPEEWVIRLSNEYYNEHYEDFEKLKSYEEQELDKYEQELTQLALDGDYAEFARKWDYFEDFFVDVHEYYPTLDMIVPKELLNEVKNFINMR